MNIIITILNTCLYTKFKIKIFTITAYPYASQEKRISRDFISTLQLMNLNNRYLVYKAFAYIGNGNGTGNLTDVIVSNQPIYFTVYTDAMIAPGYYMPSTTPSGI